MPKNRNGFLKKIDRYFIYLLMLLSVLMLLVCGCGNYDDEKNKDKGGDISFAPVIVPSNDEYKAMVTASTTVTIDGETYPIEYQILHINLFLEYQILYLFLLLYRYFSNPEVLFFLVFQREFHLFHFL